MLHGCWQHSANFSNTVTGRESSPLPWLSERLGTTFSTMRERELLLLRSKTTLDNATPMFAESRPDNSLGGSRKIHSRPNESAHEVATLFYSLIRMVC